MSNTNNSQEEQRCLQPMLIGSSIVNKEEDECLGLSDRGRGTRAARHAQAACARARAAGQPRGQGPAHQLPMRHAQRHGRAALHQRAVRRPGGRRRAHIRHVQPDVDRVRGRWAVPRARRRTPALARCLWILPAPEHTCTAHTGEAAASPVSGSTSPVRVRWHRSTACACLAPAASHVLQ